MVAEVFFCPHGAGSRLRPFFDEVPASATIYWVTFSLDPPREILDLCDEWQIDLRFICRHPRTENGPTLTQATWDRLCKSTTRVRGHRVGIPMLDGEDVDEGFGPLHAKLVVWRSGLARGLATGSFNATRSAWCRSMETCVIHDDVDAANDAWAVAQQLWLSSEPLTVDDVGRNTLPPLRRSFDEVGAIRDPPVVGGTRDVSRWPTETIADPEVIAAVANELEERLRNYPRAGADHQWKIYSSLEYVADGTPRRDLLYLPVAVGKTFIALRWLCFHLRDALSGHAVYLVPNAWVQDTVLRHIEDVSDAAGVDVEEVLQWIIVARPSEVSKLDQIPWAVVADECHNWSGSDAAPGSYTNALDELMADQVPILGLSATPCRMEHGRFDIRRFIRLFVGRPLLPREHRPLLTLEGAAREGFVCPVGFERVVDPDQFLDVQRILTTDAGNLVEMGDYSRVVLRQVWGAIAKEPQVLASRIVARLRSRLRRKVIVFLPPVGDAADEFVEEIVRASSGTVIDLRARADQEPQHGLDRFLEDDGVPGRPTILITIDRISEGVSANDVDALVMLRATLSPRVAMQALGRGLRLFPGKTYCLVLDAVMFEERVRMFESTMPWSLPPPLPIAETDSGAPPLSVHVVRDLLELVIHRDFVEELCVGYEWTLNGKGQRCLSVGGFHVLRIYRGVAVAVAVRRRSRHDFERFSIRSVEDMVAVVRELREVGYERGWI